MEKVEIRTSVRKTIVYLLLGLLFVSAGVFTIFNGKNFTETIAGIFSIIFFGFGFLVLLYQVLDRRPRIIIDEKGITDRKLGKLDWEDIKSVKLSSGSKNKFIFLKFLVNPRFIFLKLVNSQKSSKILLNATNKIFNFNGDLELGILSLNLNLIDMKPQKIYEVILNYIPEKQFDDLDSIYKIK